MNRPAFAAAYAARFARLDAPLKGAVFMIGACAGFAAMMAIVRKLAPEIHPFEAAFFRNLGGIIFMLPWLARVGVGRLRTGRPGMHLLRSVLGLGAMLLLFTALSLMPLANVTALSFTAPLFATIGAALVLREHVGLRRWTATLIGFLGAIVIVRPGADTFTPAALLALSSAAGIAAAQLSVKALSRTEHPNAIVLIMGLLMTPMALVPASFVWTWPDFQTFTWLLLLGLVATVGQVFLVRAMSTADASAVMPFDFSRLIFASLLGWLMFGEAPDAWTWAGAAVIVAATVYIARREAKVSRRARTARPADH
ncbi:MAG: DMT family transporter [Rhodospirillales bacterium]|nr:DMT family transporter [Rhodospirillales bacterium]